MAALTTPLIAAAIASIVLALLFFRRETLRTYLAVAAATWAFAAFAWRQFEGIDPYAAMVAFLVAQLLIWCVFVAAGRTVRWSPNRAALAALIVYALIVPAMHRTPIDGDEPYYLLITESLVHDRDLDLANQYAHLSESATDRTDLHPQLGDVVGPHGEQYSRLEKFLSVLMIPGYLFAGLSGAIATIVLFGALLVRSTLRWLEDEGIEEETVRAIFPIFAFGPPILFYAVRIWPEVPGAFFFVEALRGVRGRRGPKWIAAVVLLALLKLRFALVSIPLVIQAVMRRRVIALSLLIAGVVIVGAMTGRLGLSSDPSKYAIGFFGLLLDAAAGIAFQTPFFLLGVFALTRWRSTPEGFRLGIITSLLYVICLVPRSEWHGGWSPPLRYIVFLMPVLALGAASIWSRVAAPLIALFAAWTVALAFHGIAYPWRLFHIANGESEMGEWLSTLYHSDFSRLFPSYIRINAAAFSAIAVLIALALLWERRFWSPLLVPALSLALGLFYLAGRAPGRTIHFEDAHVIHNGGELHPPMFAVARFLFRGGWMLHTSNSLSFLARSGPAKIYYSAREPVVMRLGSREYRLPPTADAYKTVDVLIEQEGRNELLCVSGSVNLDKIE